MAGRGLPGLRGSTEMGEDRDVNIRIKGKKRAKVWTRISLDWYGSFCDWSVLPERFHCIFDSVLSQFSSHLIA